MLTNTNYIRKFRENFKIFFVVPFKGRETENQVPKKIAAHRCILCMHIYTDILYNYINTYEMVYVHIICMYVGNIFVKIV